MIAIIDYDAGNIKSVEKALTALGQTAVITKDKDTILHAEKVILPGVGAFGKAMERIRSYGLDALIQEVVAKDTPFLGICLGLQLLFDSSEEAPGIPGLGILHGKIQKIPDNARWKVPQIGWNALTFPNSGRLFQGIAENAYVYFVHSYYLQAEEPEIVTAATEYVWSIFTHLLKKGMYLLVSFIQRRVQKWDCRY